jgi:hypothetical protein
MKYEKNTTAVLIIVLIVILFLQGCSSLLNPLDVFKEEPKIETNVQLGKSNESESNKLKLEQSGDTVRQDAENISNDTSYQADVVNQITKNLGFWELALLVVCAGFAIPSYKEVANGTVAVTTVAYKGLKIVIADILNLIVIPVKGIRDFILTLFGKG